MRCVVAVEVWRYGRSRVSATNRNERIPLVRTAAAGRDVELHALIQRVILTADPRGAAERLRKLVPELSVDDILTTPYLWIGTVVVPRPHIVGGYGRLCAV
jgi:hypothetical protein